MKKTLFLLIVTISFLVFLCANVFALDRGTTTDAVGTYQQDSQFGLGSGSVGLTGSISYNYPMGGYNLSYSSAGGGSWNYGGSGAITRDTKFGVPQYNDSDIFLLNGEELVKASGTNPILYHTKHESYAKIEYYNPGTASSYWKVTNKDGSYSFYGAAFDGGAAPDARIEAIGVSATQPRVWAIRTTRDAANYNLTRWVYSKDTTDGGYYILAAISGKVNATTYGFSATRVYYENEPYPQLSYREGARVRINKRPKLIVNVIGCDSNGNGGNITKAYKVTWANTSMLMKPVVTSIKEYGSDAIVTGNQLDGTVSVSGSSLPATSFEYMSMTPGFGNYAQWATVGDYLDKSATASYGSYSESALLAEYLDINGDGLPDRLQQYATYYGGDNNFWVYPNRGNGINTAGANWGTVFGEGKLTYSKTIKDSVTKDPTNTGTLISLMDMNGDGLPDKIMKENSGQLRILFNTGTGFSNNTYWTDSANLPYISDVRIWNESTYTKYDLIDMNGDGLPDRVIQDCTSNVTVYLNTGGGWGTAKDWGACTFGTTGDASKMFLTASSSQGGTTKCKVFLMDMNGDGLPDKVLKSTESPNLKIQFNNGRGFEQTVTEWSGIACDYLSQTESSYGSGWCDYDFIDMNGDGLPDRVQQWNDLNMTVWFNTGNGFTAGVNWGSFEVAKSIRYSSNGSHLGTMDMNGDGLPDRVIQNQDGPGILRIGFNNSNSPSDALLLRVKYPQGGKTEYTYQPVNKTNNPGYKFKSWVVKDVTNYDGFGRSAKTGYEFYNGVYIKDKREDRGFRKVKTIAPTGDYSLKYIFQDDEKAGLVEKEVAYDYNGYIHSYIYNNYANLETGSSHYGNNLFQNRTGLTGTLGQVKVQSMIRTHQWTYLVSGETNVDNGTAPGGTAGVTWKRSVVYNDTAHFDNYGNNLYTYSGNYTNNWELDRNLLATEYIWDLTNWKFLPKRVYTYGYDQSGTERQTSEKRIYYDGLTTFGSVGLAGLPTKIEMCTDGSNWVNTQTSYDAYGNVQTVTDANGNVTSTTYDSVFMSFPITVTQPAVNGIEFKTSTSYDSLMRPNYVTDINGNNTYSRYDAFSRVVKSWIVGDTEVSSTSKTTYVNAVLDASNNISVPAHTISGVKDGGSDSLIVEGTNFDGYLVSIDYGVQKKTEAADANRVRTWRVTNTWGYVDPAQHMSISASSAPYFSSSTTFDRPSAPSTGSTYTKNYLNSSFGSVSQIIDPNGNSSFVYKKHYKTVARDTSNHYQITEVEPSTNSKYVREYLGTWSDSYISNPPAAYAITTYKTTYECQKVTDALGNVINTIYTDWMGQKTQSQDADLGTWNYTYDNNGNLKTQTDAKGQTITCYYDSHNRVYLKDYSSGTDVYFYFDGDDDRNTTIDRTGMKGLLGYVTDASGSEKKYYDQRGRLVKTDKYINGLGLKTTELGYDTANRLTTIKYPGDTANTTNTYDCGGNVIEVKDEAGAYIVSDTDYNEFGKVGYLRYGNDTLTSFQYKDSDGNYRLHAITVQNRINDIYLCNIYSYDNVGNITSISGWGTQDDQDFRYDDLNRLTAQTNPDFAGGTSAYAYNQIGNLTNKNGADYTYYPGTHKVSNVSSKAYSYDQNGNLAAETTNVNIALGKPVILHDGDVYTYCPGYSPPEGWKYINDGRADTGWLIETNYPYDESMRTKATIDLQSQYNLKELKYSLMWDGAFGSEATICVSVSPDNTQWTVVDKRKVTNNANITVNAAGFYGRYIKLEWLNENGEGWHGWGNIIEFEAYEDITGNIARSKPVILYDGDVYKYYPQYSTPESWKNINDGRSDTAWLIETNYPYDESRRTKATIDLQRSYNLKELKYSLMWDGAFGTEATICVSVSADNAQWIVVNKRKVTNNANITLNVTGFSGRYIKLEWLNENSEGWHGWGNIIEFEAYAAFAASNGAYTYDADNRLIAVAGDKQAQFTYDYSGTRVKKVENGVTTYYIGQYYEEEGGTAIKYYYANGMKVAQNKGGVKTWYHTDHLNSSSRITDINGNEVRMLGYKPFGDTAYTYGSGEDPKYKYTGKEKDNTGLYYMGARYYDPVLCRFIQADTIWDIGPQGLNRYSYCENNPIKYRDPSGHMRKEEGGGGAGSANGNDGGTQNDSGSTGTTTTSTGITSSGTITATGTTGINTVASGVYGVYGYGSPSIDPLDAWGIFSGIAGPIQEMTQKAFKNILNNLRVHVHSSTGYTRTFWKGVPQENNNLQSVGQNISKYSSVLDKIQKGMFIVDMGAIPVSLAVDCSNYNAMLQSGQIDYSTYKAMVGGNAGYSAVDAGLTAAGVSNPVVAPVWGGVKLADAIIQLFNINLPTTKEFTVQSTVIVDKLGPLGTLRAVGDEMANSNTGDSWDGGRQFLGRGMQGWATAGESLNGIINSGASLDVIGNAILKGIGLQ